MEGDRLGLINGATDCSSADVKQRLESGKFEV